ncbi:hypothetical protein [Xanthomonas sp. 1678]|uniref:hypothetical protein n=1 Tax=Xanthomonas sp. 1678 TaxID=3158788 RepID=UPI002862E76F|nr:hypothetical protein [Xanthomonas translucens]
MQYVQGCTDGLSDYRAYAAIGFEQQGHNAENQMSDEILSEGISVIRHVLNLAAIVLLTSCALSESDERYVDTYYKYPRLCSAADYVKSIDDPERIDYFLGSMRVKPRPACVAELISLQDAQFLFKLQKAITDVGTPNDRVLLIDGILRKAERGEMERKTLEALDVGRYCVDLPHEPGVCRRMQNRLHAITGG